MSFDAGSVVGHFKLDDADWKAGANRVQGSNKGLTGSVFKANLAYDAFKQTITAVANALKASVQSYLRQEQAVAQLNAVLKSTAGVAGVTKEAALELASSMQNVTKFGDEAVLEAENLLLTFTKIGKDVFPAATEAMLDMSQALGQDAKGSAIQLGKALQDPILGVTALRRVGVNFNEAQQEVIKNLVRTGRSAEAQAMILKELQTEFGGSARAARDTFGGALAALDNRQDDLRETVGKYIATAGRPFVELMSESVLELDKFLQSQAAVETFTNILAPLVGTLSVASEVGRQLWDMFVNLASGVIDEVKEGFIDLFGTGNDASIIFQVLGTVVKTVSIGFTILGKIIAANVHWVFNLVKIIVDAVKVLVEFGKAMANPLKADWGKVWNAITGTWEQIKKTGVDAFNDVKDVVTTTINEFKTLITDGKLTGEALEAAFKESSEKMREAMRQFYVEQKTGAAGVVGQQDDAASEVAKSWKETFVELRDSMKDITSRFGVMSTQGRESINKLLSHVFDLAGKIASTFTEAVDGINGVFQQYYENQLTLEDNDYQEKKAFIEANVDDEDERTKQLEALEAEHSKKTADIKKKQFAAQKTADIISAVINTAQAVMTTFSQFGFPFGLIPAAIMAAIGAAQVAVIASQPTPEFAAEGGSFRSGQSVVVGEQGPELLTLGSSARVTPNDELPDLLGGRQGTREEEFMLHATFIMDSRVLADFTTRAVRNGQIIIEAKDVR